VLGRSGALSTWSAQAGRYVVASALSGVLSLSLPFLLHEVLAIAEEVAVAIALVVVFFVNFVALRSYVFRSDGDRFRELTKLAVTSAAFRVAEYGAFLLVHTLAGVHYLVALAIVLSVSAFSKFCVQRAFVFVGR
jgi:putative flippase GtrA